MSCDFDCVLLGVESVVAVGEAAPPADDNGAVTLFGTKYGERSSPLTGNEMWRDILLDPKKELAECENRLS